MISLARALRTHLGADCAIAYRKQFSNFNNEKVLNAISREFEIYDYRSIKFLNRYASRSNFDIFYAQKAGDFDGVWLPDLHNFIHVVFQSSDVHGDSYAYISKWLADEMSTRTPMNKFLASRKSDFRLFRSMRKSSDLEYTWRRNPFSDGFRARRRQERSKPNSYLPYPVDLPSPESSLRQKLRIPEEAIVLGSLSARGSFDIPWVRAWLPDFLARQNNFFFWLLISILGSAIRGLSGWRL